MNDPEKNNREKKRKQELRELQRLMKSIQRKGVCEKEPLSCRQCRYFRPDFRYRTCLFACCPYEKKVDPFRRKPLKNWKKEVG